MRSPFSSGMLLRFDEPFQGEAKRLEFAESQAKGQVDLLPTVERRGFLQLSGARLRLVLQLPTQLERTGIQDGAIQPGLLGDALPRLGFPAFARGTHVLDLQ